MPERPYTVFVNGRHEREIVRRVEENSPADMVESLAKALWTAHGPIDASSPDTAIKQLRDDVPDLKQDKTARFHAEPSFEPKKMVRRFVETWDLRPASEHDEEPPEQGELT